MDRRSSSHDGKRCCPGASGVALYTMPGSYTVRINSSNAEGSVAQSVSVRIPRRAIIDTTLCGPDGSTGFLARLVGEEGGDLLICTLRPFISGRGVIDECTNQEF